RSPGTGSPPVASTARRKQDSVARLPRSYRRSPTSRETAPHTSFEGDGADPIAVSDSRRTSIHPGGPSGVAGGVPSRGQRATTAPRLAARARLQPARNRVQRHREQEDGA